MQNETIWIDSTARMVNFHAIVNQPDAHGTRHGRNLTPAELNELGYQEITISIKPDDYSDETYYRDATGDGAAPYFICTKKSPEQIQAVWWNQLKAKRDELTENGGCLVQGKWFHTDTKSKQQQMALTMMGASIPSDLLWKTMDGSFILMTQALAAELFGAQVAREQMIFTIAEIANAAEPFSNVVWPERYVTA